MTSINSIPVELLKTKSIPVDKYEETFNGATGNYEPSFIPVLEHRFREDIVQWLKSTISNQGFAYAPTVKGSSSFGGLIFTSQRAVEAFASVVESLDPEVVEDLLPEALPLYVVGPATARGLGSLNLKCQIIGEETGNGEALAAFILDHYNSLPTAQTFHKGEKLPLLFMVGEQRRDIIPKTLQSPDLSKAKRIGVEEVVVYGTGEMDSFHLDFAAALEEHTRRGLREQWVVVFSPQGCKAMLRCLGWIDESTGRYDASLVVPQSLKTYIATIGPTTRNFLVETFGFEPHLSAEKPSPEGIYSAIESFRNSGAT